MKITVRKRTFFLVIILCIAVGFFVAYNIFNKISSSSSKPWIVADADNISKKFISKETLIKKIQQKQRLITTEAQVNEKVTIDNSWGNLDIFKKIQNISFTGTGTYSVDLSTLKNDNVNIDNKGKKITLNISSPQIEAISIDDSKTQYQTDNGLLRFGEIKLTTEEHEAIMDNVKKDMKSKMLEQPYYNNAISDSEKAIKNILNSILENSDVKYSISINFKK
ncbi:DUF4230 domain-containing protein [Clostridium felsineum]|uniref:DUF4230 domain-containing protein n=1 Tax=Clostridium felsineum TaxID=36839 RepID=UPI00098BFC79|nr:DUF4230 domain-containing protein [Clostridium felsineum]URZ18423.1 hypothetical protein CLFE_045090 [Clostridium felsineum DSM 794]